MEESPSSRVKRTRHRPLQHKASTIDIEDMPSFQRSPSDTEMRSSEKPENPPNLSSSVLELDIKPVQHTLDSSKDFIYNSEEATISLNMNSQRSLISVVKHKSRRQALPIRKSTGNSDGDNDFEMDESIQKSTIMMKRLRSKSESRVPESEYGAIKDPGQLQLEQAPAHKRHLQDNRESAASKHATFPSDPRVYLQLQPPREDGGCVICLQADGSPGNEIVLCDQCDRGFHQRCYSPSIENKFVEIESLEWTCCACSAPLNTGGSQGLSELAEDMSLTGGELPKGAKESYLWSLPKSSLVKLITMIESNSPDVRLYPSRLSSPTATQFDRSPFSIAASIPETPTLVDRAQASNRNVATISLSPARNNTKGAQSDYFGRASGSGTGVPGTHHSVKAQDLPPYEEMIFMAIADLKQEGGSAPKAILDWVQGHFPVPETFRASCGQAISKAAKKGRLLKEGAMYKLKPGYNYPRRVSRHPGSTRARSHSYNSALPPGVPAIDASPMALQYEQVNTIIDASLYGMLPSPSFHVPQGVGTSAYTGATMVGTHQRLHQSVHPFKFEARPIGLPSGINNTGDQDTIRSSSVTGGVGINPGVSPANLIGLGVTNLSSGQLSDNDNGVDSDSTRRSSSMSSVSSGPHSFTSSMQGGDAASTRMLQSQQRLQTSQSTQDRIWGIGATPGNSQSQGSLVGTAQPTTTGNPLSIITGNHHQSIYPGQSLHGRNGSVVSSPIQFSPSPFGGIGSTLPSQVPVPMNINTTLSAGVVQVPGVGTPMYSPMYIPSNIHFTQTSLTHHQSNQQPYSAPLASARLYGSISLPSSPQDMVPQLLSSQHAPRDQINMNPSQLHKNQQTVAPSHPDNISGQQSVLPSNMIGTNRGSIQAAMSVNTQQTQESTQYTTGVDEKPPVDS
ncbi:hypothetical protein BGZ76_008539 [Entomortierella beljakovae]|nr:hypothetical protein BGZ76_008539 [Entomortierella beljakovae]